MFLYLISETIFSTTILTQQEKDWLNINKNSINLYFETNFPPIEFLSDKKEFDGMSSDIMKIIEKKLNIKLQKKYSDNWSIVLDSLKSGEASILPSITKTTEREDYSFFTTPYISIPIVLITTTKNNTLNSFIKLSGKKVGVVLNYSTEKYLKDKGILNNFEVISVKNISEGLIKLSAGEYDAFVENIATASYYIEKLNLPNLSIVSEVDFSFQLTIGISRKYPLLYSIIQKTLDSISNEEIEKIRKKWIPLELNIGLSSEMIFFIKISTGFFVILIISLISISIILKKRLNLKIKDLKEGEEFRERVFESSRVPIIIMDSFNFQYIDCNQAAINIYGFKDKNELIGKTPLDVSTLIQCNGESSEKASKYYIDYAIKNESIIFEWRHQRANGEIWDAEVHLLSFTLRDTKLLQFSLIDITQRKKAEAEKERLQTQLSQAQKMESIGRLAGGIAHDFNNMLSVILGYSDIIIEQTKDNKDILNNINEIKKAAQRSIELTQQLLAFARKQVITPKILNINNAIENLLNMLRRVIGENIKLCWIPNNNIKNVKMDPTQLDQILTNLCINSKDAILKNDGIITISTDLVEFTKEFCEKNIKFSIGEYVKISVSDNGSGIDEEVLGKIFEPFFTTKEIGKGTGLGLSTVYGIVKQNGGFIDITTQIGVGTVFCIYLPIDDQNINTEKILETNITIKQESQENKNITILLVEDEPLILKITSKMLKKFGYNVISTASSLKAVEIVNSYKNKQQNSDNSADLLEFHSKIDFLITDVIMPELNGYELSQKIKQIAPEVKSIFISGYTADIIEFDKISNSVFLQKPFTIQELISKIEENL
ncbi:transporter substrate-binding domain-containing protein [bacterium]|nr:transporter substrate-binding domain-containing protein [bacterium]